MNIKSIGLSLAVALVGCSKTPPPQTNPLAAELTGAPDWVLGDCRRHFDEANTLCGVGSMGDTSSVSMARSGATSRARAELASSLQVKVEAMIKDYEGTLSVSDGTGTLGGDEQSVQRVSRQLTDIALPGSQLVASWISPSGTYYALVGLQVDEFLTAIEGIESVDEAIRYAVTERANTAFSEMDKALAQ